MTIFFSPPRFSFFSVILEEWMAGPLLVLAPIPDHTRLGPECEIRIEKGRNFEILRDHVFLHVFSIFRWN